MSNSMRFVTDLSKGVLGQPDSAELWAEIIAHIPDEVLLKPGVRILSVACGHCTEARLIAKRMLALGISKEAVRESIWLIDKYQQFTNDAVKRYGFKNVVQHDFLTWEPGMKFDVVVGNPPFQSEKRTGTQPLWPLFVKKAHELIADTGYLAMITPNKWCGHTANVIKGNVRLYKDLFKGKLIYANIQECSKYFPGVGAAANSFSYFVVSNAGRDVAHIKSLDGEFVVSSDDFEYLPLRLQSKTTASILKKTSNRGSFGFKQVSVGFANTNSGAIVISMAQRLHYSKLNIYVDKAAPYTATSKSTVSELAVNTTQAAVDSVFRSAVYRFIHHVFWNNDNFGTTFYNSLPYVDLTRTWTDAELYAHFGLTEEEIAYIEATVK